MKKMLQFKMRSIFAIMTLAAMVIIQAHMVSAQIDNESLEITVKEVTPPDKTLHRLNVPNKQDVPMDLKATLQGDVKGIMYLEYPTDLGHSMNVEPGGTIPITFYSNSGFATGVYDGKTIEGTLLIEMWKAGTSKKLETMSISVNYKPNFTIPDEFVFSTDKTEIDTTISKPSKKEGTIVTLNLKNSSSQPSYFFSELDNDISSVIALKYPMLYDDDNVSYLVPADDSLAIDIFLKASATEGDYQGQLQIYDSFGNQMRLPVALSLDFPTNPAVYAFLALLFALLVFITVTLFGNDTKRALTNIRQRKARQKQEESLQHIEDKLIQYAANNDGIVTQDDVNDVFNDYTPKDVLNVLQKLEKEGYVERSEGVYVFSQFINY